MRTGQPPAVLRTCHQRPLYFSRRVLGTVFIFFTRYFEIQLHTPMLQIPCNAAGHLETASALAVCGEGGKGRLGTGALGTNQPASQDQPARTACCHPCPGCNPTPDDPQARAAQLQGRLQPSKGGDGWPPHKAVPHKGAGSSPGPHPEMQNKPLLPTAAPHLPQPLTGPSGPSPLHRAGSSHKTHSGLLCEPTVPGANPPTQHCPCHQLFSAFCGTAGAGGREVGQSSSLVHHACGNKTPKSWQ